MTEKKGRGVFAAKIITTGELIEVCPVLVLPAKDTSLIDQTVLYNYYFGWGETGDSIGIALGLGSLYNHSFQPNARYSKQLKSSELSFVALRTIDKDEEITTNYNGDPTDQEPVWFAVAK